jgi:ethylbenzene dioxygenase beta subunit
MKDVLNGVRAVADVEPYYQVVQWMNLEAELLDDLREREWLEQMVSKDIVYQVPLRITVERFRGLGFVEGSYHLNERYGSLDSRIARNESGYAWAEDPPSRCRHFVSNIRVGEVEDGVVKVRSNLLMFRTRGEQTSPVLLSAERRDVLKYEGDALKLHHRVVLLDHTAIGSQHFGIFF